jgi:hypothetical protein
MTLCARLMPGCTVLLCVVALLVPLHSSAQGAASASIEARRQQLLSLFDEEWQYVLRTSPEYATMLGDNRYNDRLSDDSPELDVLDSEVSGWIDGQAKQ